MTLKGSDLLVRSLLEHEVKDFFCLVGGPISGAIVASIEAGIRAIDVRDERAGTFAGVAYSRLTQRPSVVMTCSGPGTTNTVTGVAHAFVDGAPVIVLGGSTAQYQRSTGAFQDIDQVSLFRPITKWSHQVTDPDGVSDAIARAFQIAMSGAPGPVYLDLPSDVLYGDASDDPAISRVAKPRPRVRCQADPSAIDAAVQLLSAAQRPVVLAGSGVLWSQAWDELAAFVDASGIPFYTTPMTSGLVPEDHPLSFQAARSTALREADCVLLVGTRDNYIVNNLQPPVFDSDVRVIEINVESAALSRNRVADVAILADAALALGQLTAAVRDPPAPGDYQSWIGRLRDVNANAREKLHADATSDEEPIHPLRLATEVHAATPRDAIRVLDGRETLAFGRRAMSAYAPSTLLNPGTFGTMGVGVPFAMGAKVARPDAQVVLLLGDGAFGYHVSELDTAVRHGLGFVCVVANNAGWTAHRDTPAHALAHSEYHEAARMFGCWGTKVTSPADLAPAMAEALEYAATEHKPAVINAIMASIPTSGRNFTRHARTGPATYAAV
jgi:thiamine pyrophosphate-dependent acetolactate synthase large subunit-like protein